MIWTRNPTFSCLNRVVSLFLVFLDYCLTFSVEKTTFPSILVRKTLQIKQKTIKILQIPYKEAIMGFWSPNHGVGCLSCEASLRPIPPNRFYRIAYYVS